MSDDRTIATYEAKAGDYAALGISETQAMALSGFIGCLPAGGHVLDLGCGPGLHAAEMMRAGLTVDALDATPAFVAEARSRGVDARLGRFGDVTGQDIYDGIWSSFSLLHAPRDDVPGLIAALARALKPGGAFFLGMKLGEGEGRDGIGRRYSYFSEAELTDMLEACGLSILNTFTGAEAGLSGEVAPYALITARG